MNHVNTDAARGGEHEPLITVHFNDFHQPDPIPRLTWFADHFEVSFALYFQNSTNQVKFIRDIYSYDRNRFCFLPATTHFEIDPDFSFFALCTLSLDSLIRFNNQKISNAIQSDLDNDPIAYRIISTSSILVCYTRRGDFVCLRSFTLCHFSADLKFDCRILFVSCYRVSFYSQDNAWTEVVEFADGDDFQF